MQPLPPGEMLAKLGWSVESKQKLDLSLSSNNIIEVSLVGHECLFLAQGFFAILLLLLENENRDTQYSP